MSRFDGLAAQRYSARPMSADKLRIGVLVSGSGTNLQALIDAVASGALSAEIALVISSRPDAVALARAARAGIPTLTIAHGDYPDRATFDGELLRALNAVEVSLVVLAGFMRLLTPAFIQAFPWRIVNIHPALLPAFPGTHAPRQALEHGVKIAGCTVHFVDTGTDDGAIIAQAAVPVLDGDDEAALAARILLEEHRLLVEALVALAEDRVAVTPAAEGRRPTVQIRARPPRPGGTP